MNTAIKAITIILAAIGLMAIGAIIYSSVTDTDSTRRRVEVLKSNKQGDPDANRYDFSNDEEGGAMESGDGGEMEQTSPVEGSEAGDQSGAEDPSDEADTPTTVTLTGQGWAWQRTEYTNGETVTPEDPSQYVAQFTEEKTFSSTTGCNNFAGSYTINGNSFSFGPIAATKRACLVPTLESEYGEMLSKVVSYRIEGDLLVFLLSGRSGTMTFRANGSPIHTEPAAQGTNALYQSAN